MKKEQERIAAELKALESQIKKQESTYKQQLENKEKKIQELSALNDWYIEQLKLKVKEKFGASSEKVDPNQLSLFDLFNEAETLKQPITVEPELETVIKAHTRKKIKKRK